MSKFESNYHGGTVLKLSAAVGTNYGAGQEEFIYSTKEGLQVAIDLKTIQFMVSVIASQQRR